MKNTSYFLLLIALILLPLTSTFAQPRIDPNGNSNRIAASEPNLQSTLIWHPRLSEALAEAKRTGKNIFIDFTGYTCTNCRAMEMTIFRKPEVIELLKGFVLARLYTDNGGPLNDSNMNIEETRFNTIALPYYVILSPHNKPLSKFPGFTRDKEAFVNFIKPYSK